MTLSEKFRNLLSVLSCFSVLAGILFIPSGLTYAKDEEEIPGLGQSDSADCAAIGTDKGKGSTSDKDTDNDEGDKKASKKASSRSAGGSKGHSKN